ncbi:unnamed protein product, partial [marine sediment metagenome]
VGAEVLLVAAVAVMGKSGYDYLKVRAFGLLRRYGPPAEVSRTRYRIGLVFFVVPFVFGWVMPYAHDWIPFLEGREVWFALAGDILLLLGLILLIGCDCFPFTDPKTGKFVSDWDTPWGSVNTHPRTVGAHAKVLRLARERKVDLTLMQAISKMSYQYAKFLEKNGVPQMAFKGRLQVGADADITIFDPKTVRDKSSLEQGKNSLPSTGIPYVVVNGTIVVKDSKVLKGVYPGQPIRLPEVQ